VVEPLDPDLRRELKRAHPGLQDSEIDAFEGLIAKRFRLDPQRDEEALQAIEREMDALQKRAMPHYHEVVQRVQAEREREAPRRRESRFRIYPKDASQ
jgi:hypothetical protein